MEHIVNSGFPLVKLSRLLALKGMRKSFRAVYGYYFYPLTSEDLILFASDFDLFENTNINGVSLCILVCLITEVIVYWLMDLANCFVDGNADAVEFCPHNSFQHVLAASTYTLQEGDEPKRTGSISLFNLDADVGNLDLAYRAETAGIFDIKWNPVVGDTIPLLAQADADGYLRIHRLGCCLNGSETPGHCLEDVCGEHISSSMCLCLDWDPSGSSVTVGLSDGCVSIVSLRESQLSVVQEWKAHNFEVWATSFDHHQPHLVYSGSDDCNYDEQLRVWDLRSMLRPVNETSIGLGGGVWRIKHHPSIPGVVLTACMHNGFAVMKTKGGEPEVIERYEKHGSLAYGADWHRGKFTGEGKIGNRAVVATCSFYDRLLRVWMPQCDLTLFD
ncbi:OLC1v1036001C1 [Oldenlandia corymbosa var. corymbosa]|uniref:methylated diphthine methylhydrolase n=1 Tax=Oldenlandia corymbosa var. corymbosa TaxID=529605 RepID=A0AAV1CVE6_OLDCO|nr:OLC1v1036001C1 [Oldenlandia corymbosa var. corymbosa]